MLRIDKSILDTNDVICGDITLLPHSDRGHISQSILAQLRNFVEYLIQKEFSMEDDVDPNDYKNKTNAINKAKQNRQHILYQFHDFLQKSVSHYTLDKNSSERLMLKYYEYLLKTKKFFESKYGFQILQNIKDFPIDLDNGLNEYYEKIERVINAPFQSRYLDYQDRYYIYKVKPVFFNEDIFYEVIFSIADDKVSKFDRMIAFTKLEILDNYAVKLRIREENINVLDLDMSVKIIDSWEVSIRPCELKNFSKIFQLPSINHSSKEYSLLMSELTIRKMNFVDVVNLSDNDYHLFINTIIQEAKTNNFVTVLNKCRNFIQNRISGCNIVSYLLYKLNNKIIKFQLSDNACNKLSDLYLGWGCVPFEEMPFTTSLINHNPEIYDLLCCIDSNNRNHEFLARKIKNKSEIDGYLFVHKDELSEFDDVESLINNYNKKLYYKHNGRKILKYKEYFYINEYVDDCKYIIEKLRKLSEKGVNGYTDSVCSWFENSSYNIDCQEKEKLLKDMFENSRVSLIYGAAGTGKSTMINHVSNFWSGYKKIFLANTNPAINNLKRKVTAGNSNFYTITKLLSSRSIDKKCDILIVDECSTVSNKDMRRVLENVEFKLLILVGDIYQIESISFGNWFYIIKNFINANSFFELDKPYRTSNENLLTIWNRVRNYDKAILEPLVKNDYSIRLDSSIFERVSDDEIILCLNYDGIYGINNINKLLQNSNPNKSIVWGVNSYKIGDPILFNEIDRFSPLIHNNTKGRIIDILVGDEKINFTIELDFAINEIEAKGYDFTLLRNPNEGKSMIEFSVNQYPGTDEDNSSSSSLVPFQIAYAVSIHKSQGLEYKSVKIVVTDTVHELVTHNVFYTAITRTKEKLKIYWTPETEKKVLDNFEIKNFNRDIHLLRNFIENS